MSPITIRRKLGSRRARLFTTITLAPTLFIITLTNQASTSMSRSLVSIQSLAYHGIDTALPATLTPIFYTLIMEPPTIQDTFIDHALTFLARRKRTRESSIDLIEIKVLVHQPIKIADCTMVPKTSEGLGKSNIATETLIWNLITLRPQTRPLEC